MRIIISKEKSIEAQKKVLDTLREIFADDLVLMMDPDDNDVVFWYSGDDSGHLTFKEFFDMTQIPRIFQLDKTNLSTFRKKVRKAEQVDLEPLSKIIMRAKTCNGKVTNKF